MKSLFVSLFTLFCLSAAVFASPPPTNTNENDVRAELQYLIQKIHNDHPDHPLYASYVLEYDMIASGINGVYQNAALKISNGYLTKGRHITTKDKQIHARLTNYEKRATALINKINTDILGPTPLGNMATIIGIIMPVVGALEKHLKERACVRAQKFYEEVYWRSSEDLINDTYPAINFGFLGRRCAEFN